MIYKKNWHEICYNYIEKITEKIKIFLKKGIDND